jgi:hypothetical protein
MRVRFYLGNMRSCAQKLCRRRASAIREAEVVNYVRSDQSCQIGDAVFRRCSSLPSVPSSTRRGWVIETSKSPTKSCHSGNASALKRSKGLRASPTLLTADNSGLSTAHGAKKGNSRLSSRCHLQHNPVLGLHELDLTSQPTFRADVLRRKFQGFELHRLGRRK